MLRVSLLLILVCSNLLACRAAIVKVATSVSEGATFTVGVSAEGAVYQVRDVATRAFQKFVPKGLLNPLTATGEVTGLSALSLSADSENSIGIFAYIDKQGRVFLGSNESHHTERVPDPSDLMDPSAVSLAKLSRGRAILRVAYREGVLRHTIDVSKAWNPQILQSRWEIAYTKAEIENLGECHFMESVDGDNFFLANEMGRVVFIQDGKITLGKNLGFWIRSLSAISCEGTHCVWMISTTGRLIKWKLGSEPLEQPTALPPGVLPLSVTAGTGAMGRFFNENWKEGYLARLVPPVDEHGARIERVLVVGSDGRVYGLYRMDDGEELGLFSPTWSVSEPESLDPSGDDSIGVMKRHFSGTAEQYEELIQRLDRSELTRTERQAVIQMWVDHRTYRQLMDQKPEVRTFTSAAGAERVVWLIIDLLNVSQKSSLFDLKQCKAGEPVHEEFFNLRRAFEMKVRTHLESGLTNTIDRMAYHVGDTHQVFRHHFRLWLEEDPARYDLPLGVAFERFLGAKYLVWTGQ